MKEESRLSYAAWMILETLVRIIVSVGIIFLLYFYLEEIVLYAVVALFVWWVFSPLYNGLKNKRKRI